MIIAKVEVEERNIYEADVYIDNAEFEKELGKLNKNDSEYKERIENFAKDYIKDYKNLSNIPLSGSNLVESSVDNYTVTTAELSENPIEIVWLKRDIKIEVEATVKYPTLVSENDKDFITKSDCMESYNKSIKQNVGEMIYQSGLTDYTINHVSLTVKDIDSEEDEA